MKDGGRTLNVELLNSEQGERLNGSSAPLTIVLWLWSDPNCRTQYTPEHVERCARAVHANLTLPHRFVLMTDRMDKKYDRLIEPVELWDDWRRVKNEVWRPEFPQCYVRLRAFAPEMKRIFGDRFVSIDLDCVVLGNLDAILSRAEDFIICKRARVTKGDFYDRYQASMWMMNTGAREDVWSSFHGEESLRKLAGKKHEKLYLKTDQGWMLYKLGRHEAVWTMEDGVYHWPWLKHNGLCENLPANSRIVFFNGREEPWTIENPPQWL